MKIPSIISDGEGGISSKRVFGIWCLIVATIGFFTGKQAPELGIFMGAATVVFLGQAFSKT
jgi:hypothetical protein